MPREVNSTVTSVMLLNMKFVEVISKVNQFDEIRFDFSKTQWVDAEMTVALAMMLEISLLTVETVSVDNDNINEELKTILRKNNFFPQYGIASKLFDTYGTTINFFANIASNDKLIYEYIHEEVFPSIRGNISQDFLKEVSYCIFELVHNVTEHSNSERVYMCGQHYPQKRILRLAISDIGLGLPSKIKEKNPHIVSDTAAVEWALEEGNTTKRGAEGGIGLYSVRDKLLDRGVLKVISNQAYYEIKSNGSVMSQTMPERFRGTLIILEFDIKKCLKSRESGKIFNNESLGF